MNILFFLTPKALCSYIDDGCTLRQAMERMENFRLYRPAGSR
ncbi:MAG: hypothetical protein ACLR8U_08565 [Oscillospiraceae bacterium]